MNLNTPPTTPVLVPGSAQWRRIITASKVAPILGISPWQSPAKAWLQMRGEIAPDEVTDAMRRGTIQEESILTWFFEVMRPGLTVVSGEQTFTRPDLPWAAANPDAVAEDDGEIIFVEAKSVARDGGEWGEPGTDEVPLYYFVQVLWQMHMTHHPDGLNVERATIVKHGPFVDQYDAYEIRYDAHMAGVIEQTAREFHASLDDDGGMPGPVEMVGEQKIFAKLHPEINREASHDLPLDVAAAYITARDEVKAAEARESKAKADILHAMGEARTAVHNGVQIAYRRPTKNGVALYPPQRTVTLENLNNNNQKGQ